MTRRASGAETEAELVVQQFETAQFFPRSVRKTLSGEIVCYGRDVVHSEWPAMSDGKLGNIANPWALAMFRTMQTVEPKSASEQAAYSKWFDQRSDRESARADRTHGAEGVIPPPLWIVLFLSAIVLFLFMLLFADSAEPAFVQAVDDRRGRDRHHLDAVAALVPRQPVSLGRRRAETGRDGADARTRSTTSRRSSAARGRCPATHSACGSS